MYWPLRDTSYIDGALQCHDTNKLCNSQQSISLSHSTEQIYKILHHLHTAVGPTPRCNRICGPFSQTT